jgi:hypothetical protein
MNNKWWSYLVIVLKGVGTVVRASSLEEVAAD